MSMDVDKICRTCLALTGPFITIYNNDSSVSSVTTRCIADMLNEFTNYKVARSDELPEKVCLTCVSEINRCYSFKIKCENSLQTLAQLIPNVADKIEDCVSKYRSKIEKCSIAVQTLSMANKPSIHDQQVQTDLHMGDNIIGTSVSKIQEDRTNSIQNRESALKRKRNFSVNFTKMESNKKKKCVEELSETVVTYNEDTEILHEPETKTRKESKRKQIKTVQQLKDSDISPSDMDGISNGTYIEISAFDFDARSDNNSDKQQYNGNDEVIASDETEEYNDLEYSSQINENNSSEPSNYNFTIYNNENGETEVIAKCLSAAKSKPNTQQKAELKCSECPMTFVSVKNLKRHVWKRHDSEANSRQPAHKIIQEESELVELQDEIIIEKVFRESPDEIKSEEVASTSELNNANNNNNNNNKLKFFCERCNAGFALRKSLNYHHKQSACTAKNYKCNECDRVFNSEKNLEEHKTVHIGHVCTECNKAFGSKDSLSEHLVTEHKRSIRNQCDICKKVFTMFSALRDHLRIHTGEKPFLCTLCGKAFSQNANLKQHMMRHSNMKNFQCDECFNSYVTKAELFSHKRTHTGDQPFKCDFCDSQFTTSSSLVKHKRKHTGERPYACDICPMRFAALNVLKNHRRTHTGEKPYKCSFCDKSFTQKGDCQIHQRTHTGVRKYVCSCGEKFTHLGTLRTHAKIHERDGKAGDASYTNVDLPEEDKDVLTSSLDSRNRSVEEEYLRLAIEGEDN